MSRSRRQLAFLVGFAFSLIATQSAVYADAKRSRPTAPQRVVSVTQDLGGNFVLLNLDRGQQLSFPSIRYLPGPNGSAVMAVDFPGAVLTAQTASLFSFPGTAIRQVHIGQLQSTPPVMRATFMAANAAAFKRVEFRSSPGTLTIRLPDSPEASAAYTPPPAPARLNTPIAVSRVAPAPAPPFAAPPSQQGAPSLPAATPSKLAATSPPATPNRDGAASSSDSQSLPVLRGPIELPSAPDAHYIKLPTTKAPAAASNSQSLTSNHTAPAFDPVLPTPIVTKKTPPAPVAASLPPQAPALPKPAPEFIKKPPVGSPPQPLSAMPQSTAMPSTAMPSTASPSKDRTSTAMPAVAPDSEPSPQRGSLKRLIKRFFAAGEQPPETAPAPTETPRLNLPPIQLSLIDAPSPSVVVGVPSEATPKTFRLHGPERYVIDIEGADSKISLPPLPPALAAYIRSIRLGSPEGAPATARIVFDLVSADTPVLVKPTSGSTEAGKAGSCLALTFGEPAAAEAKPPVPHALPPGCLVVLDAGHGGSDPGAQRGDIQEKELTLQIVEKLKRDLESKGVRTRLTRADDTFVSLEERVRITNELQPDAFVSVHINSLETNAATTGIETYFQTDASKGLAQLIHTSLVKQLGAPDRGVRKARFYVINHTPVPAILAEVGYISNKEERDRLADSEYQHQIADALTEGVVTYLSEHASTAALPAQAADRKGDLGTISALPASSNAQSFTQNLQTHTKPKPQPAHQSLKFKKSRVATTRS